jgi:hypothetical protein
LVLQPRNEAEFIVGRDLDGSAEDTIVAVHERLLFLQLSLLYHAWVDNGPHDVLFLDNNHLSDRAVKQQLLLSLAISQIGELQTIAFPRDDGDGHFTQKMHDWYGGNHVLYSLILAGKGRRIKADVTEKQHKYFCKAPGQTALKHSQETFLKQLCARLTTTSMLTSASSFLGIDDDEDYIDDVSIQRKVDTGKGRINVSPLAHVQLGSTLSLSRIIWKSRLTSQVLYHPFVAECIQHGCLQIFGTPDIGHHRIIELYTELNLDGNILRCHPNYRKDIGPWYDWVMVKWEAKRMAHWIKAPSMWTPDRVQPRMNDPLTEVVLGIQEHVECDAVLTEPALPGTGEEVSVYVPARILAFVCVVSETTGLESISAIIQSCDYTCFTESLVSRQWRKQSGRPDKVVDVVDITCIACPCLVVEAEPGFYDTNSEQHHDMVIHEMFDRRTSWGPKFLKVVQHGVDKLCTDYTRDLLGAAMTGIVDDDKSEVSATESVQGNDQEDLLQ